MATRSASGRVLDPDDADDLERFLAAHADTAMFLRSNVRAAGLIDRGETYQGTYVARIEGGAIAGVVCHAWNGLLLIQAADGLPDLIRLAVERSGRGIEGLVGPLAQVRRARSLPGLDRAAASKESSGELFALDLDALVEPPCLTGGETVWRRTGGARERGPRGRSGGGAAGAQPARTRPGCGVEGVVGGAFRPRPRRPGRAPLPDRRRNRLPADRDPGPRPPDRVAGRLSPGDARRGAGTGAPVEKPGRSRAPAR